MAKTGFSYYRAETDRFQDIKIKRLKKRFGCTGYAVYQYILNEIYRVEGCFLQFGEDELFDVADYWGIDEEEVRAIMRFCCEIGLFNESTYDAHGILTARSIQMRYSDMCKLSKRKVIIPSEYLLIEDENQQAPQIPKTEVYNSETPEPQNSRETIDFSRKNKELLEKPTETPEKNNIEKKSKEKEENILPPSPQEEEEILSSTRKRLLQLQNDMNPSPAKSPVNTKLDPDAPPRNTKGLLYQLEQYKLSAMEVEEVLKLSNYGEIGNEVWQILAHIASNASAIKSPRFFLLSKIRNNNTIGGRKAS